MWKDYLRERRIWIGMAAVTMAIFVALGCLYHIENLPMLLYAALLTGTLWILAGVADGNRYIRRRQSVARAMKHPKQAVELLREGMDGGLYSGKVGKMDGEDGTAATLEDAYENLVGQLCRENELLSNAAEEKRTEQNDYYLMWAHQIKTPIAAMRLLMDGQTAQDAETRRNNFLLQEELFKIEQYVEMVLHFQRLESMASDLILQEFDLHTLLRQSVKKHSVLFINRFLSMSLGEIDARIVTDEKWFEFCIDQILSNSIKYTAKGGVSIYIVPESSMLVIEDTGIGICAEDLPRIFERGFTGYNGRMNRKSTGIGLYLTGQILEKLGIGIRVESEEGAGTKVFLDLSEVLKDGKQTG